MGAALGAATLMLAFAAVGLAHFTLYRTAVGVAVGVFVIGVALLTVVPALLMGLGPWVFWPLRPVVGAEVSGGGTWARLADAVTRRPLWALVPLIVLAALALLGSGPRSCNEVQQLPQNQPSVQAFDWIEQGFGGGEVLPMNVVLYDPPTVPPWLSQCAGAGGAGARHQCAGPAAGGEGGAGPGEPARHASGGN